MGSMPQVSSRELLRFLKARGFVEDRLTGSHVTLWHEGRKISITTPSTKVATSVAAWRFASSAIPASAWRSSSRGDEFQAEEAPGARLIPGEDGYEL